MLESEHEIVTGKKIKHWKVIVTDALTGQVRLRRLELDDRSKFERDRIFGAELLSARAWPSSEGE